MILRRLLLPLLCLLTATVTRGTAQHPDRLRFEGQDHPLYDNPLEDAFDRTTRPKPDFFLTEGTQSTANWRGYIATWELREDRLYLTKIEKEYWSEKRASDDRTFETRSIALERVFPGKDYPLPADWYSGVLRVPQGELIRYVHMGYGSMYEREILFKVEKGRVVERREISRAGENLYRSDPDMQWTELGGKLAKDDEPQDWIDARLLLTPATNPQKESGKAFKVRGIFFARDNDLSLWIPETPKTRDLRLPIHRLAAPARIANGSHAELTARFVRGVEGELELHVSALRELKGGESMHAKTFPSQFEQMSEQDRAPISSR